jgi:glutathione S-transferase
MILHYAPGSAHSASLRIVLAEKGIAADARRLDLTAFEQHSADYLARDPSGMVPLLEYDGTPMGGTFPLMLFIDELHPENPLAGSDARARYLVHKWGKYVETHIAPQLAIVRWQALRGKVPEGAGEGIARLPRARRALWQRAARGFDDETIAAATKAMSIVGERLAGDLAERDYLAEDRPTLADFAVYPHLAQFAALGLETPAAVAAWIERIAARPSAKGISSDTYPLATMGPEAGRWG